MRTTSLILVFCLGRLLVPSLGGAVTHTINQNGLTWDPANITIEVGDTVQWFWNSGSHTVTSGSDLNDPEVGLLFDQALNSGNTAVTHTFTQIGSQDFFCRPHLNFGMTGTVTVGAASPVGEAPGMPSVRLFPNQPNPFNPSTLISFELPGDLAGPGRVNLRVFDLQGRLVRVLMEEIVTADRHTVVWDGRDEQGALAPSGLYVYRLAAGGRTLARTMTLVK